MVKKPRSTSPLKIFFLYAQNRCRYDFDFDVSADSKSVISSNCLSLSLIVVTSIIDRVDGIVFAELRLTFVKKVGGGVNNLLITVLQNLVSRRWR